MDFMLNNSRHGQWFCTRSFTAINMTTVARASTASYSDAGEMSKTSLIQSLPGWRKCQVPFLNLGKQQNVASRKTPRAQVAHLFTWNPGGYQSHGFKANCCGHISVPRCPCTWDRLSTVEHQYNKCGYNELSVITKQTKIVLRLKQCYKYTFTTNYRT